MWRVIPFIASGLHCRDGWQYPRDWVRPGHPAHHERAPLRRVAQDQPLADSGGHPAHHERAPLRLRCRGHEGGELPVILPSIGGLHCGHWAQATLFTGGTVVPPFNRRAPLRRLHRTRWHEGRRGHPAVHRRAPLRHVVGDPRHHLVYGRPADRRRAPLRQLPRLIARYPVEQ